jgi:hypothetical protein
MKEKLQEFAVSMSMISQIYFHILNQERQKLNSLPIWRRMFAQNTSKQRIFMKALAEMSDLDIGRITHDALGYSLPRFQQPAKTSSARTGNRKSLTPSAAAALASVNPADKQNPSSVPLAASSSDKSADVVSTKLVGHEKPPVPSTASVVASASATAVDCSVCSSDGTAKAGKQTAVPSITYVETRAQNMQSHHSSKLVSAQSSGFHAIDLSTSQGSEQTDLRPKQADMSFELHEIVIHEGTSLPSASEHQRRSIHRLAPIGRHASSSPLQAIPSSDTGADKTLAIKTLTSTKSAVVLASQLWQRRKIVSGPAARTNERLSEVVVDLPSPVVEHADKSKSVFDRSQVETQILQEMNDYLSSAGGDRPSIASRTSDPNRGSGNMLSSGDSLSANRGRGTVDVRRPLLKHPTRLVQATPSSLSKSEPVVLNWSQNCDTYELEPDVNMHDVPLQPRMVASRDASQLISRYPSARLSSSVPKSPSDAVSVVNVGSFQGRHQSNIGSVLALQADDRKSALLHQHGNVQQVLEQDMSSRSSFSSTSAAAQLKRQSLATVSAYVDGPTSGIATLEHRMPSSQFSADSFVEDSSTVHVVDKVRRKSALGAGESELGILSKYSETKSSRSTVKHHFGSSAVAESSGAPPPIDSGDLRAAGRRDDRASAAAQDVPARRSHEHRRDDQAVAQAAQDSSALGDRKAAAASASTRSDSQRRRRSSAVAKHSTPPIDSGDLRAANRRDDRASAAGQDVPARRSREHRRDDQAVAQAAQDSSALGDRKAAAASASTRSDSQRRRRSSAVAKHSGLPEPVAE